MTGVTFVLYWIYFAFLVLNVFLYSVQLLRRNSGWLRIITLFLWLMLLIEIGSEAVRLLFNFNVPLFHIYAYSQSAILGLFYLRICHNSTQRKFIRWYILFMTLTLALVYALNPGAFMRFNLWEVVITNYLLVVASLFYLYNIISGTRSFLYIALGVLVCAALEILVFLFADFLVTLQKEDMMIIWLLHELGILFLHGMITVQWFDFFVYKRKNKDE
ncbi:MAG: hypothetical protein BGO87_03930 [Flavobacteriia bacterium 40-80]|nr:MAG: hypothetical protein BGO87_03930 [Flavobacteriia bacterium 40-80]